MFPASSLSAVRSGGTGSGVKRGTTDRPALPHRYASKPAAASPPFCDTVIALLAPP